MNINNEDIEHRFDAIFYDGQTTAIQKIREGFISLAQTLNNELSDGVYKDMALVELEIAAKNSFNSITRQPSTKN